MAVSAVTGAAPVAATTPVAPAASSAMDQLKEMCAQLGEMLKKKGSGKGSEADNDSEDDIKKLMKQIAAGAQQAGIDPASLSTDPSMQALLKSGSN